MKKVFGIFDLHAGNLYSITNTLNNIKAVMRPGDVVRIITNNSTEGLYTGQDFKKFIAHLDLTESFGLHIVDQSLDFGGNLSKFVADNRDGQTFVFKTTFPVFYYSEPFGVVDGHKAPGDEWFILNGHDTVCVPDRTGKILRTGQTTFTSRKLEQHVKRVRSKVGTHEPDYFVFGKGFLEVLLAVNQFKENNFAFVIQQAQRLKKPITDPNGKRVVKKMWASIEGNVRYTLIPQYVMPIVSGEADDHLTVIKFPTIVGHKYFRNSRWLGGMMGKIVKGQVTYTADGQSLTGTDILSKVAVRYDMDVNASLYISKLIRMLQQLRSDVKVKFYTKNRAIRHAYQRTIRGDILDRIEWIEAPYTNLTDYLDRAETQAPLKFDLNFYAVGCQDYDTALRDALGIEVRSLRQVKTGGGIDDHRVTTQMLSVMPMSPSLLTKQRFLSGLIDLWPKKVKIFLEPIGIQAMTQRDFEAKANAMFRQCKDKIVSDLKNIEVDVQLLLISGQNRYINKMSELRQTYSNFYFVAKNLCFAFANNYGKNINMGGVE